jgi:CP family cyanate transporter-like MFS transporter
MKEPSAGDRLPPFPLLRALLLWIAGMDLRLTLLALPPLLSIVHRDLRLSETAVAALANAPVLVLASSSMFGALIVNRLGARGALLAGSAVIAVAGALRGVGPSVEMLFAMTVVMGAGIALIQPAFPVLARAWFPQHVALASGIWTNGLLMGEAIPAALTLPVVLPLVSGSWEKALAAWSIPVAITAIAIAVARVPREPKAPPAAAWFPNFRLRWMWRLGIFQSAASLAYFGANTFIPDYLTEAKMAVLIAPCLSALNVGQLPASFLVGFVPTRILARPISFWCVALAILGASGAFLFLPPVAKIAACVVIALAAAYVLSLSFGLPSLVAEHGQVAQISAGSFTIGYTIAFLANLLAGGLWDLTHLRAVSFAPIVASALVVILVGPGLGKVLREATGRAASR